jgi:anti-anti-sigma factor
MTSVTVPVPLRIVASLPSPGFARLTVAGEINLATAPMVGMRLLAVIREYHPAVVEVDLAEVTFMDCAGIGVLVAVRAAALGTPCQLWVTGSQGLVERILDVTGLLAVLTAPAVPDCPQPPRLSRWRPRLGRHTPAVPVAAVTLAA